MNVADLDGRAQRDLVLHHIVAALAGLGDERLVFKGGTLLRVCIFDDYRWSEDLDFDWAGPARDYRLLLDAAVAAAAASTGTELTAEASGWVNVNIVVRLSSGPVPIRAEATMLAEPDSVLTQLWPIKQRWGIRADAPPILGYTATAVAADKLRCLARRSAPRDIYDLNQLTQSPLVDLAQAWDMYAASYNDPVREYGHRNHPADIRSTYLGRRDSIARRWRDLQQEGQLPPEADFDAAFDRVDACVTQQRDRWSHSLPPGELHRQRQDLIEQRRSQRSPRTDRGEPGLFL